VDSARKVALVVSVCKKSVVAMKRVTMP
jgi:hypothetical protein